MKLLVALTIAIFTIVLKNGLLDKVLSMHNVWKVVVNLFSASILLDQYQSYLLGDYHNVVTDNFNGSSYDFIIVGGGSAGSVLAARLSEISNWNILLIEAGGEQSQIVKIPWFHVWLVDSVHDWKYTTEPQKDALWAFDDQKSWWWRGNVIGGTGAINTMIYMRGNREDYDNWAVLGNHGWAYKDVEPYFKKLEHIKDPQLANGNHHSNGGPITVEKARHSTSLLDAFLEAGKFLGYPLYDQNSVEGQLGFAPFLFKINNGHRWTTADGYLKPALKVRKNLKVALNMQVRRVLFDKDSKTATGVEVTKDSGKTVFHIKARREVILSTGTIGSPQLLLLSGIGEREHLENLGIPIIHHLPGVGYNLQDHAGSYGLTWTTKGIGNAYNPFQDPFMYTVVRTYIIWKLFNTGPLAAPIAIEGNAFLATKNASQSWPDLQITFIASHPGFDGGTIYKNFLKIKTEVFNDYFGNNAFKEGFSMYPVLMRPKSCGRISLKSSDPQDYPLIQPNYLKHPDDIKILIEGLKFIRRVGDSPSFKKFGAEFYDKPFPLCKDLTFESDEYWECYVKSMTNTDHHPVGTCKMGPQQDEFSVVNPHNLKVHGVQNLRIVDASIMPQLPTGNIEGPVIMIAEKAADMVKRGYRISTG